MAISRHSMQYLNQLGLLNFVKIEDNDNARAYKLVPVSLWHNGQQFPHEIAQELTAAAYNRINQEGIEYYLVPETTINAQGPVSPYASVTQQGLGHTEVKDAPVPEAVKKYLKTEKRKIRRLG